MAALVEGYAPGKTKINEDKLAEWLRSAITGSIEEVSHLSTAISSAVEQQTAATIEISKNVQEASSGTTEVAHNTALVSAAASDTDEAAHEVRNAAAELALQSDMLRGEVERFLQAARAA